MQISELLGFWYQSSLLSCFVRGKNLKFNSKIIPLEDILLLYDNERKQKTQLGTNFHQIETKFFPKKKSQIEKVGLFRNFLHEEDNWIAKSLILFLE